MENNGRGIFYGVIGVATLVVAIIGATFAYFSAQAGTEDEVITATGASVSLGWTEKGYFHENLIPVETGFKDTAQTTLDAETAATNFAKSADINTTDCIDQNNNAVCSMYEFTISNTSATAAQQVYASLTPTTNSFTNLKFAIFKGTAAQVIAADGWTVNDTVTLTTGQTGANIAEGDLAFQAYALTKDDKTAIRLTSLDQVIPKSTSVTYTVIVWLEEIGANQEADQGASFAGRIDFTTENGGQGVTGVLAA